MSNDEESESVDVEAESNSDDDKDEKEDKEAGMKDDDKRRGLQSVVSPPLVRRKKIRGRN